MTERDAVLVELLKGAVKKMIQCTLEEASCEAILEMYLDAVRDDAGIEEQLVLTFSQALLGTNLTKHQLLEEPELLLRREAIYCKPLARLWILALRWTLWRSRHQNPSFYESELKIARFLVETIAGSNEEIKIVLCQAVHQMFLQQSKLIYDIHRTIYERDSVKWLVEHAPSTRTTCLFHIKLDVLMEAMEKEHLLRRLTMDELLFYGEVAARLTLRYPMQRTIDIAQKLLLIFETMMEAELTDGEAAGFVDLLGLLLRAYPPLMERIAPLLVSINTKLAQKDDGRAIEALEKASLIIEDISAAVQRPLYRSSFSAF